jgi:diguanylate cyclase (GGDEF)-like protein/PAS domain S-box-containing protein
MSLGTGALWWVSSLLAISLPLGAIIAVLARRLTRSEANRLRSEARYRTVFEQADDGILLIDARTGYVIEANSALLRRLGYGDNEIVTLKAEDILVEAPPGVDTLAYERLTGITRSRPRVLKQRCKDGRLLDVEVTASDLEIGGRKALCYIAHDVTERKHIELELLRNQRHLDHLAHHDSLTGLPNRLFLRTYLDQALHPYQASESADTAAGDPHAVHSRRADIGSGDAHSADANVGLAVIFLDLDNFKVINDSRGHNVGDELLVEVARQLKKRVGTHGIVARLGGDEFVVVLRDVSSPDAVATEAAAMLEMLSSPLRVADRTIRTSVSIGATLCPQDARDTDSVLRNADLAMYKAKEAGRNSVRFFVPEMNRHARHRLTMEHALRRALEAGQITVHYHPLIDVATRRIVSLEALVWWEHPQLGSVSPAKFIPIAEDSGLIVPIGEHVLRTVCAQTVQWRRDAVPVVPVAVNWSAIQLQRQSVVQVVRKILGETGMPQQLLVLEITESALMRDARQHAAALQQLRNEGIRIQMDDFGTGYSSLSYLRELPVDTIKIDRSFVNHVEDNPADLAIVSAILAMAKSLGLRVVAEGVETAGQLDVLRKHGCEVAQGFFFSRPLPADQCRTLLEELASRPSFTETLRMRVRRGSLAVEPRRAAGTS